MEENVEGSRSFIKFFLNKLDSSWGIWKDNHPNISIGKCIGGYQSTLVSVDCLEKLPFVCERYRIQNLKLIINYDCFIFFNIQGNA
jgi:hypothetical protein